jgi:hypothetical protein
MSTNHYLVVAGLLVIAFVSGYQFRGIRPPAAAPVADDEDDGEDDQVASGPPPEVVERTQIKREPGYLYFPRGSDVWRVRMKRIGEAALPAELVTHGKFTREEGYLYFLNKDGAVARAKRAVSKP